MPPLFRLDSATEAPNNTASYTAPFIKEKFCHTDTRKDRRKKKRRMSGCQNVGAILKRTGTRTPTTRLHSHSNLVPPTVVPIPPDNIYPPLTHRLLAPRSVHVPAVAAAPVSGVPKLSVLVVHRLPLSGGGLMWYLEGKRGRRTELTVQRIAYLEENNRDRQKREENDGIERRGDGVTIFVFRDTLDVSVLKAYPSAKHRAHNTPPSCTHHAPSQCIPFHHSTAPFHLRHEGSRSLQLHFQNGHGAFVPPPRGYGYFPR